jgi:hypothetical protein
MDQWPMFRFTPPDKDFATSGIFSGGKSIPQKIHGFRPDYPGNSWQTG